jgi:hypothetical protein
MAASPNLLPWFETARLRAPPHHEAERVGSLFSHWVPSNNYSALIPVNRIMPAQPSIDILKKVGASPYATVWGS